MAKRELTHLDGEGRARMVDVGGNEPSRRTARAQARVHVGPEIMDLLRSTGGVAKGDVAGTARLAGIMAAKRTHELVPMCHPIGLEHAEVAVELQDERVVVSSTVSCHGRTGVEMEAMTAAAVAALTVYDMCKSAGKGIVIENVRLLEKAGGKSGDWRVEEGTQNDEQ